MFVTIDLLKEYNACPEGISWFARHFPEGAELIDIMQVRHLPVSFLDWGFLHFTTNEQEKAKYYELVKVSADSQNVFSSHNIVNSNMVTNSENVTNSSYVYYSQEIDDSTKITHSARVRESQNVSTGHSIYQTTNSVNSNNIKRCNNISFSNYIINSHDIYKSTLITNSSFCVFNSNLQYSAFCSHMKDSDHCLFCYDQKDKHYCIFNKEINKETWEFIYNEFLDIFADVNMALFTPWEEENPNAAVVVNNNYQNIFSPIFEKTKYINWVKNLPYYESLLAYEITFNPTFL